MSKLSWLPKISSSHDTAEYDIVKLLNIVLFRGMFESVYEFFPFMHITYFYLVTLELVPETVTK